MTFTGYVYKITGACGLVYIGATNDMVKRQWKHNSDIHNTSCSKLLQKPLQFNIIDTREYNLFRTLHLVEQFYLDNNNTINQRRAYTNRRSLVAILRHRTSNNKYYQKNREEVLEKKRIYYNKNIEKANEKIKCECGCFINKRNLKRHQKSKKHRQLLNLLNFSV